MEGLRKAGRVLARGSAGHGGLRSELVLAIPPTVVTLLTLFLVEALRHERVLFASLASSAFLVYRDPLHRMNSVRVMGVAHVVGTILGIGAALLLGAGYVAGAVAMILTILTLIVLNAVHPPAISTALGFAFHSQETSSAGLFLIALALVVALVVLQRTAVWTFRRLGIEVPPAQGDERT